MRSRNVFFIALFGLTFAWLAAPVQADQPPPQQLGNQSLTDQQTAGKWIPPNRIPKPFDEPDGGMEYYQMKRQPAKGGPDPAAAYRLAQVQMKLMPLYSAHLGSELPSVTESSGLAKAMAISMRALSTWEHVGPGNIGGRTRALVINPNDPDTIYAGGVSGGIWKTTNRGQSWQPLADLIANIAVNSLVMDPVNPDILYAGTGEGYFREEQRGTWLPLRGAGIFKTTDAGATWDFLPSTAGEDFHWVNDILISPHDSQLLYAATRSGVWRSPDSGLTWTQVLATTIKGGCLDLAQPTDRPSDWLFASCGTFEQATVYRTTDAAASEVEWDAVLADPGMGRTYLAIAPSDQDVIYALSASNLGGPGNNYQQGLHAVFRSVTGGAAGSWTVRVDNTDPSKLNTLLLTNAVPACYADCGYSDYNVWITMGWYCNVIAVDPVDPDIVWAGGVDLFRSSDGGANWGVGSYWWAFGAPSFAHADQHVIVFHPDYDGTTNRTMYAGTDGGVFETTNARAAVGQGETAVCDPSSSALNLRALNNGFGITQFYHGAPYDHGTRYIAGAQDNGTIMGSDSNGINGWFPVNGGDGAYVAVDPSNEQIMYAESQRFGFVKSTDGGQNFNISSAGALDYGFLFITPFIMDPNQPRRLWTGGSQVWRTDNGAGYWLPASTVLDDNGQVSSLAVAPGDSQRVLIGSSVGYIYRSDEALSANGSTEWASVRPREGFVSWLAYDPSATDVVYATYAGFGGEHVFRSDDGGSTWESIDGTGERAVPDIPVHSVVVDPTNSRRLFLGTDLGVLSSTNGGASWAVENTGYANAVTESLAFTTDAEGNQILFAFTHGRGAWRVQPSHTEQPEPRTAAGRL